MNQPTNQTNRCSICGGPIAGFGHNPWPVVSEGRCCSTCNDLRVIPERLIGMLDRRNRAMFASRGRRKTQPPEEA